MSICPEKDIHSVYLDNELPPAYKGTYETHLATCSNCRERFLNMQHISNMLHKDADSIQLTDKELVESFARLQTKLKYSKVVHKTKFIDFQKNKWVLPAAAAVFACVFYCRSVKFLQIQPQSRHRYLSPYPSLPARFITMKEHPLRCRLYGKILLLLHQVYKKQLYRMRIMMCHYSMKINSPQLIYSDQILKKTTILW